jgi:hypothetical protein
MSGGQAELAVPAAAAGRIMRTTDGFPQFWPASNNGAPAFR